MLLFRHPLWLLLVHTVHLCPSHKCHAKAGGVTRFIKKSSSIEGNRSIKLPKP